MKNFKTLRLVIGIISMVISLFVIFQSCAVGALNAIEDNGASSGTSGFLVAIFLLAAGITGVASRNTKEKKALIACCILYGISALIAFPEGATYPDLPIWGGISAVFSLVFLFSAIKTKNNF